MTHKHRDAALRYRAAVDNIGEWERADAWAEAGRIPLIEIPEVAKTIGCKPSNIDDYFIGKDDLTIQWESKDED